MKVLVLYEELAWYFINCINVFSTKWDCEVLIICKRSSTDAPFNFSYLAPKVKIQDRSIYTERQLLELAVSFKADYFFLAGWVYKPYLNIVRKVKSKACVLGMDNHWSGSLRQRLGVYFFKLRIRPYVSGIFVPGEQQFALAKKFGFSESQICKGAYCCDFDLFHKHFIANKLEKESFFPKRFIFVGRYANEKGIRDLWDCFIDLENRRTSGWELWCLGKGNIPAIEHPKIKHFGFLQAHEMDDCIRNTGVFVLPSTFEPWGVVVHEFASAGFPLLCSNKVGANDSFLESNKNGFVFEAGNKDQLKKYLKTFMEMSDARLNLMAKSSALISERLTPEIWADKLMGLFNQGGMKVI